MEENYYTVLGISKDADNTIIKRAYHNLAKKYHPDVDPSPEAEDKMKMITVAYETLSDPKKRAEYDMWHTTKGNGMGGGYKSQKYKWSNGSDFDWKEWFDYDKWFNDSSQEKELDFSEIIELEKQIKECEEAMEKLKNEIDQCATDIQNELNSIKTEIEKLRKIKTGEESYKKAVQYIEEFKKKDSHFLTSLTLTQKKLNLYQDCLEVYEGVEKQLKDLENEKVKERVEPIEKQKEEKTKKYWDIHRKKSSLNTLYDTHYLKYEYEKRKNKEKETKTK